MYRLEGFLAVLLCSQVLGGTAEAALVTIESAALEVSYNTDALYNVGTLELTDSHLIFRPNLSVSAPPDQPYYSDFISFAATLDVRPKPGYRIDGYGITAAGNSYVGDDAIVSISGDFSQSFYGASYYSGALTGVGPWSSSGGTSSTLPNLQFSGALNVETVNHYRYEVFVGYLEEPVYETRYYDRVVEPIYDAEGNWIGETVIREAYSEDVLAYYNYLPYYETRFQTSGGEMRLDTITVGFNVTAVPLPPSAGLLVGGLGVLALRRRRRT